MSSLLSNTWYRVAELKPRLRPHAQLVRHRYRGELWYLLRDPVGNRTHRFTPAARLLIAAMNGQRSVAQLWTLANRQLGEQAPTQDEVIQLLGQLHSADLLQSDVTPDAEEVFNRGERQQRSQARRAWLNPLAVRIHLLNPNRWLDRHAGVLRRLWSPLGGLVWLAVVLPALLLLPPQWAELTGNLSDRVLALDNLVLLWLVFPVIKLLHELGHAVAVKRGGGDVTDMGLLMLVLIPVPYVDASASSVFRSKWERAMVGAAGMAVELFIAALAFYAWLLVEPGLVRSLLFNVMLVAGVSTLVFNGNPLLRYDAYYILVDLLEMPNLGQRATRWWLYQIERHLLGRRDAVPPRATRREAAWLAFYGVASTVYRVVVAVAIALFVASRFFFVGVVLAIWSLVAMTVMPAWQMLRQLGARATPQQRPRAVAVGVALVLGLTLLLGVLPAPHHSVAEAVVWLPERAVLRAAHQGRIERLLATPGSSVQRGAPLIELGDPALQAERERSAARLGELQAAWGAQFAVDRAAAAQWQEQISAAREALAVLDERLDALVVRAPDDGVFVLPQAQDKPGRQVKRGEVLAHVLTPLRPDPSAAPAAAPVLRVAIAQATVDLVRQPGTTVAVRLAHAPGQVLSARIVREVPQGEQHLPSAALANHGGGSLTADPRDPEGVRALERHFQFDLALPPEATPAGYGERAHVRFAHAPMPLGLQAWRAVRQLLLSHFQV